MTAQGLKRAAHRPSRRREIIDAATVVFAREGYAEANVEDIAQAAGVAPTAIYYHFGGKEELFAQALRAALNGFSDRIFRGPPGHHGRLDRQPAHRGARGVGLLVRQSGRGPAGGALLRRAARRTPCSCVANGSCAISSALTTTCRKRARPAVPEGRASNMPHIPWRSVCCSTPSWSSQAAALDGAFGRLPRGPLVGAVEEMCVALILSLR